MCHPYIDNATTLSDKKQKCLTNKIVTAMKVLYIFCRYNGDNYRKVKICPVTGCGAKPQRKLANHIAVKYPDIRRKERLELLAAAKPVPRTKYIPQEHL